MTQIITRRELIHLLGAGGASVLGARWLAGCGGGSSAAPIPAADAGFDLPPPAACDKDWWLCGNYAPVEETESTSLTVEGALPPSLVGLYVRNGPNPKSGTSPHWFLGDGMVHGVRLDGGKASWLRSRYVQTELLKNPDQGGPNPATLLTRHQANTSIQWHGGKMLCITEVGMPYEVSPKDLATIGVHDFGGKLKGPMTAHPKVDPTTGELHFFGADVLTPTLHYHVVDASGALVKTEEIVLPKAVMMHDFQLTETHVVFYDLPVVFDIQLAISGKSMPYTWDASNGARIGVMPRSGTAKDLVWMEVEPCYIFHTFNAFHDPTDPQKVILDAIRYPEMWAAGPEDFDTRGDFWRYTLDLGTKQAKADKIQDTSSEFPRIDDRRQGLDYRYGYAAGTSSSESYIVPPTRVEKYDRQSGAVVRFDLPPGQEAGELVFVPDSPGAGEDEGWLLGFVYDRATDKSALVVIDASDVAKGPVARVMLPRRVPHGFHGTWIGG